MTRTAADGEGRAARPHVLFLAYYFPPHRTIASVRTRAVCSRLAALGWRVTVITPSADMLREIDPEATVGGDGLRVIGTGHSLRMLVPFLLRGPVESGWRRLLGGGMRSAARTLAVDLEFGWRMHAIAAARGFRAGDVDLVLSSGGPWVSHQAAAAVAERCRCPYVLEYRDLWSGNPHGRRLSRLRSRTERRLYRSAAGVVTISHAMQRTQARLFGGHPNATVIPNGFDEARLPVRVAAAAEPFTIVYAGQFIPPLRTAEPICRLLGRLGEVAGDRRWSFRYLGPSGDHVRDCAARFGVSERVEIGRPVPRGLALEAIGTAGVAVVVTSVNETDSEAESGIITGKLFEIIGLRVPLLVIAATNSEVRRVVATTGGGAVFTASDVDGMARHVAELLDGRSRPYLDPAAYGWNSLGERYSDFLHRTLDGSRRRRAC